MVSRLSFRSKLLLVLFVPFLVLVVVAAAGNDGYKQILLAKGKACSGQCRWACSQGHSNPGPGSALRPGAMCSWPAMRCRARWR